MDHSIKNHDGVKSEPPWVLAMYSGLSNWTIASLKTYDRLNGKGEIVQPSVPSPNGWVLLVWTCRRFPSIPHFLKKVISSAGSNQGNPCNGARGKGECYKFAPRENCNFRNSWTPHRGVPNGFLEIKTTNRLQARWMI